MMNNDIFRFLVVGLISTAINYAIFLILTWMYENWYVLNSVIGYLAGLAVGYVLNKAWTFKSDDQHKKIVPVYLAVYMISLVLGAGVLYGLVDWLGVPKPLANIMVIGLTTVTNYLGLKFVVFKK